VLVEAIRQAGAQVAVVPGAERVAALAQALRDPSSPLRRGANASGDVRLPMPVRVDASAGVMALLPVKDDVDRGAANARIDIASGKAVAEEAGRRVDVYATLARVDDAIAHGEAQVELAIEPLAAGRAIAQLEGAKVDAVLGSYETKIDPQRSTKALRAAAAKVNGAALLPGETFDFNEVVGSIRADGDGGGESQIASTLHAAAFFAGLAIVERHARPRPSTAMPMGLDALVVHPSVTLRIKNTMPWPIVFAETVTDSAVRAEVRGAARTREVTFARRIDAITPFTERELADPKVPRGVRFIAQRGVPGYAITRARIVREGASSVRERDEERYPPTPQLWRVGTGEPDPKFKRPKDEPQAAQPAEEAYVAITQGP